MLDPMEVVLLWLDDLDDFVFSVALAWRNICRYGLAPGLTAAVVLTPLHSSELAIPSVALLSSMALISVLAWFIAWLTPSRRPRIRVSVTT
jgi:hypothetical protein